MTEHERYKAMKANKKTLNEFYRLSGINPINEDYDDSLTPEEQKILNDIISEMDTLNEADFVSVLKKRFSPYCSVATWYLWRSIDPEPIQY